MAIAGMTDMKAMIGITTLFWLLLAATGLMLARADAHEVATRCDGYSCSTIVCNRTGDRCRRFDRDRRDEIDRSSWRDEGMHDGGYWHYRRGSWSRNCDPENPTCVAPRHDDGFAE